MKTIFKSIAVAAILTSASAPAFADAHLSISMSCEEYNELSGGNRDTVAMMAIAELSTDAVASDGTATATETSVGTTAEESPVGEGSPSATATSVLGAGDDLSHMAEKMGILNRTCARNWDATVMEAASGQSGTR